MPNMDSINLKTKELLTYHCGCRGSLVTIAARYVADAYRLIKPTYQIWSQYDLTLSGPTFSVIRQARGGLRGPDAKNQG